MGKAPYPSPEWFNPAQPPRARKKADLVVEHRCAGPSGEAHIHQQAFRSESLVGWAAGSPFGKPHIVLSRTIASDAADLLGKADPTVAAATSIQAISLLELLFCDGDLSEAGMR